MRSLSNLLRRSDPGNPGNGPLYLNVQCRAATHEEIYPALRLILGAGGKLAETQQVTDFFNFAQQRNIELSEVWIAHDGPTMLWAVLPILSAGRTMLLFAPSDAPPPNLTAAVGVLLETVCSHFASRNIQLAQALLDPGDEPGKRVLESHGFARMAELIYLNALIRRPLSPPALAGDLLILNYAPETHSLFARAIAASYEKSLDCPGLNGVRNIEDIIAGHKVSGEFDPRHWYVLCQRGQQGKEEVPLGVLLINRLPRGESAELVYLGLAPPARGRGFGEWMMRRAFTTAASMGAARLSLAVDSLNAPALKLYYRFGMSRIGSKVAMMRRLL